MKPELIKMNLQMFNRTHANTTNFKDGDVYDPEVLASIAQAKFDGALIFTPLADVDTTLVGVPGSTITIPAWTAMQDTVPTIGELQQIPVDHIEHTHKTVTIHKIAKGFEISDEAQALGYGDALQEGIRQLSTLFPRQLNRDCLAALQSTTFTMDAAVTLNYEGICSMADKFVSEDEHHLVLFLNPADATVLRREMVKKFGQVDKAVDYLISGTMMMVDGVEVVKSMFIEKGKAVMVMVGNYTDSKNDDPVLKIVNKTPIKVEFDRDKGTQKDIVYYSTMYGVTLYNEARALKADVKAPDLP